ncbi:hypothetical protein B0A55_00838 [Friedmanniomyces simplex]|uniref:Tudor domain-containing protein n=1 Tax=Friedmanniomyces simplex TaxID=329884 RepID=A0A4V5NIR5_9PEZI|nr:hypothetical protein B0A55_00838 [Friedmanniomyces simplex]
MSNLADLQAELAEYEDSLNTTHEYLALFPEDEESKETETFLQEQIAAVRSQVAKEQDKQNSAAPPSPPTDDAPPPPPKYDMSKHPKFRKQSPEAAPLPPPDDAQQQIFEVKDVVLAKYTEDKQWYSATVVSKTGSSTDPVYTVTFKGYGNTETKRKHEIRSVHTESKKRKADGSPAVSAPPTSAPPTGRSTPNAGGGHVISAAPAVDTSLMQQQQKREPSKVSDGPTRMAPEPKRLKGQKQLQKNQSNWQSWAQSGPKKTGFAAASATKKKKESMFRTPDLPNAKVGFTGSGKPMQRDQARAKWNFNSSSAGGGEED